MYLDPRIVSTYATRPGLRPLSRQFFRYGRNRARTIRKHPSSISPRQLAVPLLAVALLSPWRRQALAAYLALVVARSALEALNDPAAAGAMAVALPTMHASWGAGFARGLLGPGAGSRDQLADLSDGPAEQAGEPV